MALAARDAGYEVHVATHLNGEGGRIEARWVPRCMRSTGGAAASIRSISSSIVRQVRALYRRLQPDLVHHVALQPSVVGSLAARGMPFPRLNALAGLGFGFTSATCKGQACAAGPVGAAAVSFQTPASRGARSKSGRSRGAWRSLGIAPERIFTVPGSGVDTERLKPLPEPAGPVTAGFVGRLLDDKGVRTLVEAHDLLTKRGENVRLLIAGDRDPANPTSIDEREIESWKTRPGLEVLGFVEDIIRGLGAGAYRCAAVAPGGLAEEPARSRGVRARHCRDRCSGLPRDRAARCQCAAGAGRRCRPRSPTPSPRSPATRN